MGKLQEVKRVTIKYSWYPGQALQLCFRIKSTGTRTRHMKLIRAFPIARRGRHAISPKIKSGRELCLSYWRYKPGFNI